MYWIGGLCRHSAFHSVSHAALEVHAFDFEAAASPATTYELRSEPYWHWRETRVARTAVSVRSELSSVGTIAVSLDLPVLRWDEPRRPQRH